MILKPIVIATSLCVPALTVAGEIPSDLAPVISQVEASGRSLFDAFGSDTARESEAVTAAKEKIKNFCDFKYKSVVIAKDGKNVVYFIALPPAQGQIVYGRHFRVEGDLVSPSTVSCSATPPRPPNVAAAATTGLVSDYPTEFHVFISLQEKISLAVGTSFGTWMIVDGHISLIERRKQ